MPMRVGCRVDDADKHGFDVNALLYHEGILYSAGDDGKIKAFTPDLTKIAEVQSNPCSVFSIAADRSSLYSCSNEGTIKIFELKTLKEKGQLVKDDKIEFWKIKVVNDLLFSGDNEGNIKVWQSGVYQGFFNTAEPIKDFEISSNHCFSVKDNDVYISDFMLPAAPTEKLQYGDKGSFMGRAPIALIGDKLFAYVSREGMDICINENNPASKFKLVTKVKGAHEKVIIALRGVVWNNKLTLFSGSWDKTVKKWNIDDDIVKLDSSLDVDIVVNAIAKGDKGEIYVGGSDGHVVRVEVE
ncbi:unnamed protein product [Acanthoscelides obtectus]|uniref:Uncharacterized protein n=1 Tax=Acanthoscelides obtectus TaxID=200917 RepID=A0A9P0K580_ACAOB|nr:unnamed protein product [Acanthoscelides obtectus]CAK1666560.1 hypothetical protein AOBTE_LOCUS25372 [Acanthoscelides obtectus]